VYLARKPVGLAWECREIRRQSTSYETKVF